MSISHLVSLILIIYLYLYIYISILYIYISKKKTQRGPTQLAAEVSDALQWLRAQFPRDANEALEEAPAEGGWSLFGSCLQPSVAEPELEVMGIGGILTHEYVWVNYNLTATSLEIIVNKGNHPQMALVHVSELL